MPPRFAPLPVDEAGAIDDAPFDEAIFDQDAPLDQDDVDVATP